MLKKLSCAALVAGAALVGAQQAEAVLLAYEGFDYTAGTEVVGQNGGSGWDASGWQSRNAAGLGGSSVTTGAPVMAGSLGYTSGANSLVTSGNHSHMFGTANGSFEPARGLASSAGGADGTSLYMSFLIQRTGEVQDPATTSPPNMYPRGANVRWWTDGGERGNIGNFSNASSNTVKLQSKDSTVIDSGATYSDLNFVVGRIDFDSTGGNMLHLWVNPDLATEDLGAAMSTAYMDGTDISHGGIDFISPFLGNNSSGRPPSEILWDEIRIGTTYADVTPYTTIPEPTAGLLAALAASALAVRRRAA